MEAMSCVMGSGILIPVEPPDQWTISGRRYEANMKHISHQCSTE